MTRNRVDELRAVLTMNALWTLRLRRPAGAAWRGSKRLLTGEPRRTAVSGLVQALGGLPWVLRDREVVSHRLAAQLRRLDDDASDQGATTDTEAVTR